MHYLPFDLVWQKNLTNNEQYIRLVVVVKIVKYIKLNNLWCNISNSLKLTD